jgi:hypothetical protein
MCCNVMVCNWPMVQMHGQCTHIKHITTAVIDYNSSSGCYSPVPHIHTALQPEARPTCC